MARLTLTNKYAQPIDVVIEPWGDLVAVASGDSVGVICSESEHGYVDVIAEPGRLTLYAEGDRTMELRIERD